MESITSAKNTTSALIALCALVLCTGFASPPQTYVPGQHYFGRHADYVEYIAGDGPMILGAPHCGYVNPAGLLHRANGGRSKRDSCTREYVLETADLIWQKTGKHPHVILCNLHRSYTDTNIGNDAADPIAADSWNDFQNFIDNVARPAVLAQYGKGLYLDCHSHEDDETPWRDFGYDVYPGGALDEPDPVLDADTAAINSSSMSSLGNTPGQRFSEIIRGWTSLGGHMQRHGFMSISSPAFPTSVNGDHNFGTGDSGNKTHSGGGIDGVLLEMHPDQVQNGNRPAFDDALSDSIIGFIEDHYGINLHAGPFPVATPIVTPDSTVYRSPAVFLGSVTVIVSTRTPGAQLRYTTDGVTEPTLTSALYNGPLTFNNSTTFKVKAFKAGMLDSTTVSSDYRATTLRNPENPVSVVPGVSYRQFYDGSDADPVWFAAGQNWYGLPNYDLLTPVAMSDPGYPDIPATGAFANFDWMWNTDNVHSLYGYRFTGYLDVPADGLYTFHTSVNDACQLRIGTALVVDSSFGATSLEERWGGIGLKAGKHAIRLDYCDIGRREQLLVSWSGPNFSKQRIPNANLYRDASAVPITPLRPRPLPAIALSPLTLNPSSAQGDNAAPQIFTVTNSGVPGTYLKYTITYDAPWLSPARSDGSRINSGLAINTGLLDSETISVSYGNSALGPGTYTGRIIVERAGLAQNDRQEVTVILTVTGGSTPPAIITQPADQSVTEGQTATFSVVAGGTAPLSYQWLRNGTVIAGATSESYTTPATTLSDSGSTFAAVVSNSAGSVISNSATLKVGPPPPPGNQPPAVAITSPADGSGFTSPADIPITADAFDSDGFIAKVDFYQGGTLLGTGFSPPFGVTWTGVPAGSYTLTAIATDDGGATASSSVNVTVKDSARPPPTRGTSSSGKCGATGLETLLVLGMGIAWRRFSRRCLSLFN